MFGFAHLSEFDCLALCHSERSPVRTLLVLSSLVLAFACTTNSSNKNTNESSGGTESSGGSENGGGGSGNSGGSEYGGGGATAADSGGTTAAAGTTVTGSGGATATGGASAIGGTTATSTSTTPINWVGSWMTAQQLVESTNLPPVALANNTIRQIFQVSIGGTHIRLKFSNEFSSVPVTFQSVHAAKLVSTSTVDATTDKALTFNGQSSVTIAAKGFVWSDPIDFTLAPLSKVAVSIFFGSDASATVITGHPGSRTTSYIQTGDGAAAASLTSPTSTDHWYYIANLDVDADSSTHAVAILGDSITDGRGSTTNSNNRWTDALAKRLQTNAATTKVGVLNAGIGGNTILSGGLGPTASVRFDRDIVGQSGVKWAIIFEGVNDIGYASTTTISTNLIDAYTQFVKKCHNAGLKAYGATITPFGASSYYTADHETIRQAVNTWIRTPGNFDAVLDFDAAVKDPANAINLLATYSSDGLHLSPTGYQKLADSIDLTLFQ
jgi:lysophospholipase L1-like esterase